MNSHYESSDEQASWSRVFSSTISLAQGYKYLPTTARSIPHCPYGSFVLTAVGATLRQPVCSALGLLSFVLGN